MHRNDQPSGYKTPEKTTESRNESTMLPNDLQKGVDLINALIDSRTTDGVIKKKLIRKIIRHLLKSRDTKDITQMIMSYSDQSNTKNSGVSSLEESEPSGVVKVEKMAKDSISGVSALGSSSSSAPVVVEPKLMQKFRTRSKEKQEALKKKTIEKKTEEKEKSINSVDNQEVTDGKEIKEWLLPVTQSEIEKENARKSQQQQQKETPHEVLSDRQTALNPVKNVEKATKNNEILEFLENEKKTHYNWIDQEIEHLKNLKQLLQNISDSNSDESNEDVSEEKINSVYAKHNKDYLTIYENFRRNTNHTSENGSQADISSTLMGEQIDQDIKKKNQIEN